MTQPQDLKKLAEELSDNYLSKGVPLTHGLEKIAETYGLNHNQLHRVAE